jgi:ankyrin repeat protein
MSKTRLFQAVKSLDLDSTREILESQPGLLHVRDNKGWNLLHLACSADCRELKVPEARAVQMADYLLDRGIDIESTNVSDKVCDSMPVIWFAVCRGRNHTLVKHLIQRGAKPMGLYAAGWWQDLEILDTLIQAGAEIDVTGGFTPFLACWCWKKFEAAKLLAKRGADVNLQDPKTGKTALHYGIEREFDPSLLKWLVQHGALTGIRDKDGTTPLEMASRKRNKRFFDALTASASAGAAQAVRSRRRRESSRSDTRSRRDGS